MIQRKTGLGEGKAKFLEWFHGRRNGTRSPLHASPSKLYAPPSPIQTPPDSLGTSQSSLQIGPALIQPVT